MNLRVIKKDINYMVDEFVSDAVISMSFHNDNEKAEQIVDLINEVLDQSAIPRETREHITATSPTSCSALSM